MHLVSSRVSFASLYQNPRTDAQDQTFHRGLAIMGDLYASPLATTILQIKEIPPRPPHLDATVCLFGVQTDEARLRAELGRHGEIVWLDLAQSPAVVRFATRAAALAATAAGLPSSLCAGIGTQYNERPYDERGWCVLPFAHCAT